MKSLTTRNAGFTLVELMVVIALIALLAGATIPSMISVFTAGAESQAANLFSAQLTAARALAMRYGTRAGVHVQMGVAYRNPNFEPVDICYIGVVWDDPTIPGEGLTLAEGYPIQPVPGTMAFGQLTEIYIDTGPSPNEYKSITGNLREFACFTIVFSPTGSVVTTPVEFETTHADAPPVFTNGSTNTETAVWLDGELASSPNGVTAVTLFDYVKASMASSPEDYLNENGQFLPVNVHTGLLHPRR